LRRRVEVARGDLASAKEHVARLGGVGVDPLLPNSRLGVPFHLDHIDLVVSGSEGAEEGPVGKAKGDPRQRRMRSQQCEEDEFALGLVGRLDRLLEKIERTASCTDQASFRFPRTSCWADPTI
jgi:hypothetical protein